MGERRQPNRWRCLSTGCNPVLDAASAIDHTQKTGHRTAKWPERSPAGRRAAKRRNKSGYYDKYNVGAKSYEARGLGGRARNVGLSPEDMSGDSIGQWSE